VTKKRLAALLALALAAPALAYIPPATSVLRDTAKRRDETQAASVEARGSLAIGDAAPVPATLWVKSPGRCRLELAPPGASPAERPTIVVRSGRIASIRAAESFPSAVAIAEAACAMLSAPRGEGSDRALAQALAQRGVSLASISLGHLGPRIAWVLGGPPRGEQPQAWIDKQELRPLRLVADLGGSRRDVRFLEWAGAPTATFPHVVEVFEGETLEARLAVDRLIANPRVPDSMF
jgi:hypothetical protein